MLWYYLRVPKSADLLRHFRVFKIWRERLQIRCLTVPPPPPHRSDVTARSCPQQRWSWSWTRWLCVGERIAESRRRGSDKRLEFRRTGHQKDERGSALTLRVGRFVVSVKRNELLPGPVPAGRRQYLHLQPRRFIPRVYCPLFIAQISSITDTGEETGPWTKKKKGTYKKCHCCVLEVRGKTHNPRLGTTCCQFPQPAVVRAASAAASLFLCSFLGIYLWRYPYISVLGIAILHSNVDIWQRVQIQLIRRILDITF